jgi:hypothetical protein
LLGGDDMMCDEMRSVLWREAVTRLSRLAGDPSLTVDPEVLADPMQALDDRGYSQVELARVARLGQQRAHEEGAVARAAALADVASFLSGQPTDSEERLIRGSGMTDRARKLVDRFTALVYAAEKTPGGKRRRAPKERERQLVAFFASHRDLITASDAEVLKELGGGWARMTLRNAIQRMEVSEDPVARKISWDRNSALKRARGGKREHGMTVASYRHAEARADRD